MNATTATEEKDDQEENFVHKYTHLNGISIPNPSGMFGRQLRKEFLFDENYINMNHGSFGTYPRHVRHALRHYQDRAEAQPDKVLRYDYLDMLDKSREELASLLNVGTETIVLVGNATTGVNTILRSLVYQPGDVIVYFDAIYPACEKTIQYLVETTAVEAVKVEGWTFPVEDDDLVAKFYETVKEIQRDGKRRAVVAVYDTVCSLPGVRMPFEKLTEACRDMCILSLIDGAHGIGHVKLDLTELNSDFFVSNCHKWLFVPRGCAVLHVPLRNQHLIRSSLPTSHGFIPKSSKYFMNPLPPSKKSPFVINFEFVGTNDNGPFTCVPAALKFRSSMGGEDAIITYCTELARQGGRLVAYKLGTEVMDNASHTHSNCCFTTVRLPIDLEKVRRVAEVFEGSRVGGEKFSEAREPRAEQNPQQAQQSLEWREEGQKHEQGSTFRSDGDLVRDRIVKLLVERHCTFMAVVFYREAWWVRLSAQIYLELEDFNWSAGVLREVCKLAEVSFTSEI